MAAGSSRSRPRTARASSRVSDWMVERYLLNKTLYDIAMRDDIDNPDERIQDNVEPFVDALLGFPNMFWGRCSALRQTGCCSLK